MRQKVSSFCMLEEKLQNTVERFDGAVNKVKHLVRKHLEDVLHTLDNSNCLMDLFTMARKEKGLYLLKQLDLPFEQNIADPWMTV